MLKKVDMQIRKTNVIALDTVEMVLKSTYISQTAVPGQFLHVNVPGHTLRRPISIADVNRETETITILFKTIGSGTKKLASYLPGMKVNALGPCGKGFPIDNEVPSNVLLIGGGIGVPPLYYLGKTLAKKNINMISVLGFQTAINVFYENAFSQFSDTHIVTNDGTYGEAGFVTAVLDKIGDYDRYYACGPLPMLQAITKELDHKSGYISLEERMGCGVGACFACVIPTDDHGGYKKICRDGPVFKAQEVCL
ncbi:dihydroorotate dehydrogenase electron transfer subunit [Virgibacillus alimentarius]|uniref:Dihydroorotate dehydrogenase B (NAD(+)), electron transfer subunit n=1 Tax=Virgibacillus alimentarius TaxID=698769 RepID=A0ABS4S3Z6_9BACI|nr:MULTISPECIES: dihydroorotate dehydrogenase electron transfer subunit [Virgibacillus]MBP2256134.1 dihydroorotate dehydrogenase electron transfer subunit [Virgibacillus alimentarius]HLR66081.1 dihydroorotate dehydrogenase electron transfer subunit [Virgibacillus sp.]